MGGMAFELTDQIERHLAGDLIAWLTTVTPAGRPVPRPVWFVWDGSAITIYSLNDGANLRYLQVNDQVAVHFSSTADGGDVVVIWGRPTGTRRASAVAVPRPARQVRGPHRADGLDTAVV
jgi:PPOX class probable F420-dependent enzyme